MSNFDEKTGIRYGVISPHSISSWSLDEIYQSGTDPQYEESKKNLIDPIREHLNNFGFSVGQIDEVIDPLIDIFNEFYESDGSGIMDYEDSEYTLHNSGDNFGIYVIRSPYYTYCRGCSPCAPGAGDLDAPITDADQLADCMCLKTVFSAGKALCLGPEWFDKEESEYSKKIPYRVFRVDNDQEVI